MRPGTTETSSTRWRVLLVEPGCTGEDGGGDRRRQAGRGARADQLGDVERVPAGGRVHLVRPLADQRCDRALRERLELEEHRVLGRDRSDGREEGVAGRHLAGPIGEDEQRRQRADAPPQDGDRVERRVVCPLDILENEHGRVRRPLQLGDQQGLDLVRGGAGGKSRRELSGDRAREVSKRAERPRDRQVVAGADERSRPSVEIVHEPGRESGLADPGLAGDEDHAARAPRGRLAPIGQDGECAIALEQFHVGRIKLPRGLSWAWPGAAAPRATQARSGCAIGQRCTERAEIAGSGLVDAHRDPQDA